MIFEIFDLSLLSLRNVKGVAVVCKRLARQREGGSTRHELREVLQRRPRSRTSRRIPGSAHKLPRLKSGLRQSIDTLELGLDAVEVGGRPGTPGSGEVWNSALFNDQTPRRNQCRQLGVPELTQQPPDVAIDRFRPDVLT